MKTSTLIWCCLQLLTISFASPTPTITGRAPQSTACGDIVNAQNQFIFNASLVYECLTSVPFNPAVATRFLQYYNDTLQFQSTLSYLKNPPTGYQQPSVDLLAGLDEIQDGVNSGIFQNQYEFEASLQTLLYAAHDDHVNLYAGILAAFSFGSPRNIASVSSDGKSLPKVFLVDDLFNSQGANWQPSAISTINGQDAIQYLKGFAANNSVGTLEPNSDWNQLMQSPALDIQGIFSVLGGGATFFPGDTITWVLENGTQIGPEKFLAVYNSPGPTGPLETGGDFYNFFVLGFYPASFDPDADDTDDSDSSDASATATGAAATTSSAAPTPSSWNNPGYPAVPDVAQPDLGTFGGGFLSGYFLNSSSIAVLSIPSFDEYGDAIGTFQSTTTEFLARAKAAGLQKVVIDVQTNIGGDILLAVDTFKQFFPGIDPFGGSRMRAHNAANVMGNTITAYWNNLTADDADYYALLANEWVITDKIDAATGQNFTSWEEFFGPVEDNGDTFTNVQQFNFSSELFDTEAVGGDVDFAVYGFAADPATAEQPYDAQDIIILSDGICSSSCALFMEMMVHEAGVRVVAAGGLPSNGPMQAPAGSRGAREYTTDILDSNIDFAQQLQQEMGLPDANFLPNRTEALDVFVTSASINLRDQVRRNDPVPLQFKYEAADCRIFFTPSTFYNYTNLWNYAAQAIWTNPSLCVAGSTGQANHTAPALSQFNTSTPAITSHATGSGSGLLFDSGNPIADVSISRSSRDTTGSPCQTDSDCKSNGGVCFGVNVCGTNGRVTKALQCVQQCFVGDPGGCQNSGRCFPVRSENVEEFSGAFETITFGVCLPPTPLCSSRGVSNITPGRPVPPSKK